MEKQKAGRAFKYCLSDPGGELPTCPQLPSPDDVMAEHMGTGTPCGVTGGEDDDWAQSSSEFHDAVGKPDANTAIVFDSMDPDDLDRDDWTSERSVLPDQAGTDLAPGRASNERTVPPSTDHTGGTETGDHKLATEQLTRNLLTDPADPNGVLDGSQDTADSDEA